VDTTLVDPLIGRLLDGRYRIESRLARGGMASVYAAVDTRLDRQVAVKVMHPALADDREFVGRFIREARSAARLSHPNVVAVFDQGTDAGAVFLVMEYVPGHTVRDLLRTYGRLSPADTVAVLEPVAAALAAAHRGGLVHRDVKPENVLIAPDGRVKVADFGLARAVATSDQNATTAGLLIGTVAYLAPEQVQFGVADARSDVYAAGVLGYELLTGRPPYDGETPLAVAYRHVHEDVPAPSAAADRVPPALDRLIVDATARDPDRRPADGTALLERLRAVRAQEGLTGRIPGLAGAAAEPLSPTVVAGPESLDPPDAATRPPTRRRGRWRWWVAAAAALLLAVGGALAWWFVDGRYTAAPRLTDLPVTVADSLAHQHGFHVRLGPSRYDDLVPAGDVAGQQPGPGARILPGGTIVLDLSLGKVRVHVPALSGLPVASAESRLRELHLVPVVRHTYSTTVHRGLVASSQPGPGAIVTHGSSVVLSVSLGPPPFPMPNVANETVQTAIGKLTADHLVIGTAPSAYSNTVPKGEVISTTPAAGADVFPGESVSLLVSRGPQLFRVPGVVGDNWRQAEQVLTRAGFRYQVDALPVGPGNVVEQSPAGGSEERAGTVVTLYVF
jgi:beta-lactam-binding protein with PASTA domain/tRNA A-37 threonylcarbamoyl transferase component Bud32